MEGRTQWPQRAHGWSWRQRETPLQEPCPGPFPCLRAPPSPRTRLPFLPCFHLPREEPHVTRSSLQAATFPPHAVLPTQDSGQSKASAKSPAWSLFCQVLKQHSHQQDSCSPSRKTDLDLSIDCFLYQLCWACCAPFHLILPVTPFNRWEREAQAG